LDALTGYAVGQVGAILKTTNGGVTWVSQTLMTTYNLLSVDFPLNVSTGYAVGGYGTILKTTDGGTWVEQDPVGQSVRVTVGQIKTIPNPFIRFAVIPGHEKEAFVAYDIAGRKVGTYKGDRIGEGLPAGVYFLVPSGLNANPLRVVKLR
jgi:hypothetical protein